MIPRKWYPISPLSESVDYDFLEINSLKLQWLAVKHTRGATYDAFLERLTRSWAIETGIIEGLYTLDREITETLIARGISAELIAQSATNKNPHELALMLNDHQDAVNGVYAAIRERRPISRSSIRQIHATVIRNQPTFEAMNQFGQRFNARLNHGAFKTLPNNPTRPDGAVHEYCPPEHVAGELDNLLQWYDQYCQDTGLYHPLLTVAWLHHCFTQIHPFPDGNGRVVRTLLTWHLVREDYLPVVVKRDDREDYIEALEKADGGNLIPFVNLLVRLQRRTILEAIGEPETGGPTSAFEQVLNHIVAQVSHQNAGREAQMRAVNGVAETLCNHAVDLLEQRAGQVSSSLQSAGRTVLPYVLKGGPNEREHWYRHQVVQTANSSGHWVNFNESRFLVRLTLTPSRADRLPRLVFVVSLHHTGRQLTGIMATTAFALIEHYYNDASDQPEEREPLPMIDCTSEPFTFTGENNANTLLPRFKEWTEQSLAIALGQWGQYLA